MSNFLLFFVANDTIDETLYTRQQQTRPFDYPSSNIEGLLSYRHPKFSAAVLMDRIRKPLKNPVVSRARAVASECNALAGIVTGWRDRASYGRADGKDAVLAPVGRCRAASRYDNLEPGTVGGGSRAHTSRLTTFFH